MSAAIILVEKLHTQLSSVLEGAAFRKGIALAIFLNPVALAPQVWVAFTAPSLEGISLTMWVVFFLIQGAFVLEGIRVKSASTFYSMGVSILESLAIIAIVLIRG